MEQDREAPAVDHGMMDAPDELMNVVSEPDERRAATTEAARE